MARRWLTAILFGAVLLFAGTFASRALAQNEEPTGQTEVIIEWPNEGETLYAGPSSLQYSVPLKGRIAGLADAGGEITVELRLLREGQLLGSYRQVTTDHTFSFLATVNPHSSEQLFPAEHQACADDCHRPGAFELTRGALTLQVAIVEPAELVHEPAERNIFVDRSVTATIPVELRLEGDPDQPVAGVTVSAATWLYLWRSRQFLSASDSDGIARLPVEALGLAPTEYLLRVEPSLVDGVLYEGIGEARVELAPGTTAGPAVTLHVRARQGRIDGQVRNFVPETPCQARAISLPEGNAFSTAVSTTGAFSFVDLPIDQYRVVLDSEDLSTQQAQSMWEEVNLTATFEDTVSLPLAATPGLVLRGQIVDEAGQALPFGWVDMGDRTAAVLPADGRYAVAAESEDGTLLVQAPGFYSEARTVEGQQPETEFVLKPAKETQRLPWGTGSLWWPAENVGELDGQEIGLVRGWIWGTGEGTAPFRITTSSAVVTVAEGRFAVEYLPGEQGWLYVFEGEAELQDRRTGATQRVPAGQMVNLLNDEGLQAVPYEPVVLSTLNGPGSAPTPPRWEPSLSALFRNRVGVVGVGAAQLITFVTYILVLLSLGITPLVILYFHYRRRRAATGGDNHTQS